MKLKFIALSGMVACLLLASCNKKEGTTAVADDVPEVKLAKVVSEEIGQSETYTATVESDVKNNIAPNTPMRIRQILVEVGDHVNKGQVLAILDPTSQNQVDYQIASQRSAISGQQATLKSLEASLKSTEAQLANTEREAARIAQLYAVGGISASDNDAAQLSLQTQRNGLEAQRSQIQAQKDAVSAQQAQLSVLQAQQKSLVENNRLIAPVSGVVTARNYDNGDIYSGNPVLTIEETNVVKLKINVSEVFYSKIQKGMHADVTLDAYPGETFNGTVSIVNPSIDVTTHTFPVEITITNEGQKVRPGMFARAVINYEYQNHVVVPDVALVKQMGAGDRYVYVYNPSTQTVAYKKVELGKHMGDKYEIMSGINAFDQVVVAGQSRLANGKKVKVVK